MLGDVIHELDLLETLAVELDSTHHHAVNNWKHLALVLGISRTDIESLRRPVISPSRQLIGYLIANHSELTVTQFREVLQKINRQDVVAFLDQYIPNPTGNCSR